MAIQVERIEGAGSWIDAVGALLEANEARHGLLIGLGRRLARDGGDEEARTFFAAVRDGDDVVGAAMRTPGRLLLLSDMPLDALAPLAVVAHEAIPDLGGVHGEASRARAMACALGAHRAFDTHEGRATRLYTLDAVVPPRPCRGTWRLATLDDQPLLDAWANAFLADVGDDGPRHGLPTAPDMVARDALLFWEVDGAPVCVAGSSRESTRSASITFVYTPPERRGQGFASNATAVLSQRLLDGGKAFTALYADAANPTTNRIYQALGYRPIADEIEIRFVPRPDASSR